MPAGYWQLAKTKLMSVSPSSCDADPVAVKALRSEGARGAASMNFAPQPQQQAPPVVPAGFPSGVDPSQFFGGGVTPENFQPMFAAMQAAARASLEASGAMMMAGGSGGGPPDAAPGAAGQTPG